MNDCNIASDKHKIKCTVNITRLQIIHAIIFAFMYNMVIVLNIYIFKNNLILTLIISTSFGKGLFDKLWRNLKSHL